MVAVNVVDGVKYGFRLIGYLLAFGILAFILAVIGGAFMPGPFGQGGNIILAMLFYLAAILVFYAGSLGMLYKVIADGVERGNLSAKRGGGMGSMDSFSGGSQPTSAGGNRRSQQRQGRQQRRQPAQQGNRGGNQQQYQRQGAQNQGTQNQQNQGGQNQGGQQPPEDWEPGN